MDRSSICSGSHGTDVSVYSSAEDSSSSESGGFASKESRQVKSLRIVVVLVLTLACAAVSAAMYSIARKSEEEEFRTRYEGVAAKVMESYEQIVSEKLSAMASIGIAFTSYARATNQTWPMVTLNDWSQRASSAKQMTDALMLGFYPLITEETKVAWENYTLQNDEWYWESLQYQHNKGIRTSFSGAEDGVLSAGDYAIDQESPMFPFIYQFGGPQGIMPAPGPGPYLPLWQVSPLIPTFPKYNVFAPEHEEDTKATIKTFENGQMSIGRIITAPPGNRTHPDLATVTFSMLLTVRKGEEVDYMGDPMSVLIYPVFDNFEEDRRTVAVIQAHLNWASYFDKVVPPKSMPVTVVLENPCDGPFTYKVDNSNVDYMGAGDLHEPKYDHMEQKAALNALLDYDKGVYSLSLNELDCPYHIRVYPTKEMEEDTMTNLPLMVTIAIVLVFACTALVFLLYDVLVERRQKIVLTQATDSTAIMSAVFPDAIRKRMLEDGNSETTASSGTMSATGRLKSFLAGDGDDFMNAKPIADLFPFTTVLNADICGFSAWSSTREPAQIFILLQTLYGAFDQLAKKHNVYKVETQGDSYVAVTGLPYEQPKHAVLMARFAFACQARVRQLFKSLEVKLGPDTSQLAMRFGLHSGPVTAGVLRGDRPRFQVFGSTVNTATQMEQLSHRNRIQVSETTARELEKFNKGAWLTHRKDGVSGAGVLEMYWLDNRKTNIAVAGSKPAVPSRNVSFCNDLESVASEEAKSVAAVNYEDDSTPEQKEQRLVDWCVEVLLDHLQQVVAQRRALNTGLQQPTEASSSQLDLSAVGAGKTCLDEVLEKLELPSYDPEAAAAVAKVDHRMVEIPWIVREQLHEFVTIIASTYRLNPFHNFEHACHVTMSVGKMISRITAPELEEGGDQKTLHEYTHGLTSDPLMLMAIVFSALIHDSDHPGCSNTQLATEAPEMAAKYQKSLAEQRSLDLSWEVLMRPQFGELRRTMFADESEGKRFRQLVVNVVLATDIFDKELNALRKQRWTKAFDETQEAVRDDDLRATIVIEHIIQASDVAHTMQHWHIYRKWNARLFEEMHAAFKAGRMGKDPAEFWYKGEMGFFDGYVIPLAKKLKDCNVFGVSSDECLNYALMNRKEWEQKGEQIVRELICKVNGGAPLPALGEAPCQLDDHEDDTSDTDSFHDEPPIFEHEVDV